MSNATQLTLGSLGFVRTAHETWTRFVRDSAGRASVHLVAFATISGGLVVLNDSTGEFFAVSAAELAEALS